MKKIIIFSVLGLLLLGGAVGGTLYFTGAFDSSDAAAAEAAPAALEPKPADAIYFEFRPEFVVNFEGNSRPRYMQANLVAVSYDTDAIEALELHMPLVRNNLLLLFAEQKSESLKSREGKEALLEKALAVVQEVMTEQYGKEGIDNVYFTRLVMQ